MFTETKKYKTTGHFFFRQGDNLSVISKSVPEQPGVYYIFRLANDNVDLVFIGKSGTADQPGNLKKTILNGVVNHSTLGSTNHSYIADKMAKEKIEGLDIYWFVTMDENTDDLPQYAEGVLKQRFYNVYGRLPEWNK